MVDAGSPKCGGLPMSRILLGGMLAVLVAAGATILTFKLSKPVVAQHHTDAAVPADPTILHKHLQNMPEEMALP
jgi:hypothetical protein